MALIDGRKEVATAGTAERLVSTSQYVRDVLITAENNNTQEVLVGASTVDETAATRRGRSLEPGEALGFEDVDLYEIWIDPQVNTEGVYWLATY